MYGSSFRFNGSIISLLKIILYIFFVKEFKTNYDLLKIITKANDKL